MKRRARSQLFQAAVMTLGLIMMGSIAAGAQMSDQGDPLIASGPDLGDAPAAEEVMRSEASLTRARAVALAAALRHEAERLHAQPDKWGDAAALHIHAADARGLREELTLSDLTLAGNLFFQTGDLSDARTALEMAGDVALRQGDPQSAWFSYAHAAELASEQGDRDAAQRLAVKAEHAQSLPASQIGADRPLPPEVLEEWRELLTDNVIPAPSASVTIGSPALSGVGMLDEGVDVEPVSLDAPVEVELPEIESTGVILPAPAISLSLEAPEAAADLSDASIEAPELERPNVGLPPIAARDLPVSALTVVPVPAPRGVVQFGAPSIESLDTDPLTDARIDAPALQKPPAPGVPELEL